MGIVIRQLQSDVSMPSSEVVSVPAMATAAQEFAFVSWDGSNGRRACPLATFGSREPQVLNVRLACAEPPRADQPELKNAEELRGAIALVVRGGCSFAHKARLLQRAGAVAMLLANNTRDEPLAAFTMGESAEDLEEDKKNEAEAITISCVMMCLRDVRELFLKFPPSVKNGELSFEILQRDEGAAVAETCLRVQRELYDAAEAGKGWKAIKRTTTSFIKMLEPQNATTSDSSAVKAPSDNDTGEQKAVESVNDTNANRKQQPPLLAFVQWTTSSSTYEICFAPLADFCSASAGASYTGKLVACDPLLADNPLSNAEELSGAVALLRRGSCSFPEKLERVQRAGAVAAIVCNDDEEDLDVAFVMSVDHIDAANATLPAVMISHNTFLQIQPFLNVTTARILCLAGEAADGLLASSGKAVSFSSLPMPSRKDQENGSDLVLDLHVACRDGDHASCQRVLSSVEGMEAKRTLVNTSCVSTGLTALHHACAGGNDNVVELLLQLGATPDAVDLAMQTPLHVACANSHVECARLLLRAESSAPQVPAVLYNVDEEYGGLPTRRNIGGGTAMHEAARAGSSECVELLLSANARVEKTTDGAIDKYIFLGVSATDLEGNTPLHLACANAHAECALYLVAANADVNLKDSSGHSPLFLACEAANDPVKEGEAVQIIEKLIASGAVVEEYGDAEKTNGGGESLVLDRIESPDLRRDLEVLYLRHEAQKAKQRNLELGKENKAVNTRIEALKDELTALRSQVNSHDAYENQIQQLQLQMQMILQLQTSYGQQSSSAVQDTVVTPLLATSFGDTTGKSDEELALDAALARDLGKKCLRQSQSVLAEKYFQRSLELMPLPGVHRLLATAKRAQCQEPNNRLSSATSVQAVPYTNGLAPASDMVTKMQQLQKMVQETNATPQARALLDSELDKLKTLSDDAEFALACRWVEWLVALPWGDPSSGLQSEDLCTVKRSEFQQLDAIDTKRIETYRSHAARSIQRTFRKCYAVHLRTRAEAATLIQAATRGKLARLRCERTRKQLLEAQDQHTTPSGNQQDGIKVVTLSKVDYAITIDPSLQKKLPRQYRVEKLIVGNLFWSGQQIKDGIKCERNMRVLQLVKCVETYTGILYTSKKTPMPSSFFVWTRWGPDPDQMCACSLCGPYENQQDAQRRFDRITCEDESYSHDLPEDETTYGSGFSFLKAIVGVGSSKDLYNNSARSA